MATESTSEHRPGKLCVLVVGLSALALTAAGRTAGASGEKGDFSTKVGPLLEARCIACHGKTKVKGGLDLGRPAAILKGGDSGPAVVPGKAADSLLIQKVDSGEMPPGKAPKLSPAERDLLRRWVDGGAVAGSIEAAAPRTDAAAVAVAETAGGRVSDEDRQFWAFRPPVRAMVPKVAHADRVRTPIDAFLLDRLEAKGLSFQPDAPRELLIRRLCFDLLGLPPTLEQRAAFLADERPDAYERLVDRLLAAPEYGERWGRHWLDVAGYADSDGYLAADRERPEAWRYRDYVIRAHNDDLPFDRFLTEQLAGDELEDWRAAEVLDPERARPLVATGFLRTASDPTYPGYVEPNEINQVISDTMQIVGSTFLGLTLQCARCHAHKSDPISQGEYYALRSLLVPALDPDRWHPSGVRGIPAATDRELAAIRRHNEQVAARVKDLEARLKERAGRARRERLASLVPGQPAGIRERLALALEQPPEKRSAEQKALLARLGTPELGEAALKVADPAYRAEADRLKAAIAREAAAKRPDPVLIRGLADLAGDIPLAHVLVRGDPARKGAVVSPGVPEVLTRDRASFRVQPAHRSSGRRLALARWLTRPDHPLTARVQVNRMWARHFGRGLVSTTANLGRSGSRPTHPELLDWMATEFVRVGWSMKTMHRLMVNSTAYRQTSRRGAPSPADPDDLLLSSWRPRRVEGEVVRDSILSVAGKLQGRRFGPPAPIRALADGSVETPDDEQGNRRSIYLTVRRSQHVTMLDLFDTPIMEINCPERMSSTVPLQALGLMHSSFAERAAAALADRILRAGASPDDEAGRVAFAYRLLFCREPGPGEAGLIRDFLAEVGREADPATARRVAWTQAALVLLNSNELIYID